MVQKLIFAAILGAVIGYITNWLAIKMLFRPHHEKRIGGIRVPFTPGLIPKEQGRIAKSVGEAIGSHLLTNETMVEALKTNGVNEKFKKWVEAKIMEVQRSSISLGEQIKKIVGASYEKLVCFVKNKIANIIISTIKKDNFKNEIENVIINGVKKELSKRPQVLLENDNYKKLKEKINVEMKNYKDSQEFKDLLFTLTSSKINELENSDKTLEEIIPISIVSTIKVYVYNKNYDISMVIKDMLKDDKINQKIKDAIKGMLGSNLNPMIAMFLNADVIYEKISSVIEHELDKEDTQKNIALFINDLFDKILEGKASNVFSSMSEESKDKSIKQLCKLITEKIIDNKLFDEIIKLLELKISNKESIEDILTDLDLDYEQTLRNFIRSRIDYLSENKKIEEKVYFYVDGSLNKILNMNLDQISEGKETKICTIASNASEVMFDRFVTNKAGDFIEAFNIKKIVEDKINSFEVSFAEEIILEIASKELSAITWLGALLGFIMGFLSTLIASI
ncbi:DUF445 family protein [Clostridium brassicae]|uniref:DUF445 family protein n=1 Tax=Clostridium brassicae TaxID=2999072 RepID=A0ABT4DA65_9CLOT|nr:DUF445 family protein [Clostridium brassicae]MCY6959201.1 DUF445 family protein [Clostridium brassicae]